MVTTNRAGRLLLGEPLVEGDLAELGVRAGHEGPLAQPHAVVRRLLVGDDLARVALRGEALAHQLVQPELLRAGDLAEAVERRALRDPADARGDVLGRDRLD